jgi:hypothetical protein
MDELAAKESGGFTNTGESLFEAVARRPVDFLGKTCGLACSRPEYDLSKFVVSNYGIFDTRDGHSRNWVGFRTHGAATHSSSSSEDARVRKVS